ncbi:MAG: hypothetical protein AAF567_13370 [Actinomycetota bacterium]
MRAYRLHDTSWTRIVTHRVRRPNVVATRLNSRRRRDHPVPVDGQLVLISGNHQFDPRTGTVVERRELLDRLVEALSVAGCDGVVASADLLEELALLNVLERRLAICTGPGHEQGISVEAIQRSNFDGVRIATSGRYCVPLANQIDTLQAAKVPSLVELVQSLDDDRVEFDTSWTEWVRPLESATRAVSTGAGVWFTLPPIIGMSSLAAQTGFPVLTRDTDVPIDPQAWVALFARDLPLNVRGMVMGSSALFPIKGSVGEATAQIVGAVRDRLT